jgi:hypothetical protein
VRTILSDYANRTDDYGVSVFFGRVAESDGKQLFSAGPIPAPRSEPIWRQA